MKIIRAIVTLACAWPLALHTLASTPPNIVLIYADDLGWKDVGYQGSDFHETPNIDRLAREGMSFQHGYSGAGNCAPSRACLLSGTYTPRHHVFAVGSTDRGPKKHQRLVPVPNRSGLPKDTVTIADALRSNGYTTGIFGKWHLDGNEGAPPQEQGFDVVFDSQEGNPNQWRDRPEDPKGVFSITRSASGFIRTSHQQGKPFFAYLSHHAIHSQLEARPSSIGKFKSKAPGTRHRDPLYAACTYDLDAGVGMILDLLRELGIEKNTLVVFTSDNGATLDSPQEPLRGNKGGYFEGGIRVPFAAWWPGTIRPATSAVPVHQIDLFPTFLAVAKAAMTHPPLLDGENLLPILLGADKASRPALFWHFPGYLDTPVIRGRPADVALGYRTRPVSVIRKGDWKLHLFHEEWLLDGGRQGLPGNHAMELYHLSADMGETTDLAESQAAKCDELLGDLLAWLERTNAPLPVPRGPEAPHKRAPSR